MTDDPVRAIADAVLYEGYVLWPYRRSALKNQQRWTFGGVLPARRAEPPRRPLAMRTECLVEGDADAASTCACASCTSCGGRCSTRRRARSTSCEAPAGRHLTWEEAPSASSAS